MGGVEPEKKACVKTFGGREKILGENYGAGKVSGYRIDPLLDSFETQSGVCSMNYSVSRTSLN